MLTANNTGTDTVRYTVTNSLGCTSLTDLIVAVNVPVLTTSQNGATPTATGNQPGATYQWVDCNNNYQPIAGAVARVFTAMQMETMQSSFLTWAAQILHHASMLQV